MKRLKIKKKLSNQIDLKKLKKQVDSELSEAKYIQKEIKALQTKKKRLTISLIHKERALELAKIISLKTQKQLELKLNEMVSDGLNTVFDQYYDFIVKYETRREKTECDLFFKKEGYLVDPLRFSGLGAADVAAFALRCASWTMLNNSRNVLLLDEPFKHLKGEKENIRVIQLMKTLSDELKLQIICINDERAPRSEIITNSDRVFEVTQIKGKSKVKQLKEA